MNKFYSNINDITSQEGVFIEAGSLFHLEEDTLVLVDDDVYASVPFNEELFESAFETEAD